MLKYKNLSEQIESRIISDRENNTLPQFYFDESNALRRDNSRDKSSVLRPAFIRDIDKIMHCPYYNRYADKNTQKSFHHSTSVHYLYIIILSYYMSSCNNFETVLKLIQIYG